MEAGTVARGPQTTSCTPALTSAHRPQSLPAPRRLPGPERERGSGQPGEPRSPPLGDLLPESFCSLAHCQHPAPMHKPPRPPDLLACRYHAPRVSLYMLPGATRDRKLCLEPGCPFCRTISALSESSPQEQAPKTRISGHLWMEGGGRGTGDGAEAGLRGDSRGVEIGEPGGGRGLLPKDAGQVAHSVRGTGRSRLYIRARRTWSIQQSQTNPAPTASPARPGLHSRAGPIRLYSRPRGSPEASALDPASRSGGDSHRPGPGQGAGRGASRSLARSPAGMGVRVQARLKGPGRGQGLGPGPGLDLGPGRGAEGRGGSPGPGPGGSVNLAAAGLKSGWNPRETAVGGDLGGGAWAREGQAPPPRPPSPPQTPPPPAHSAHLPEVAQSQPPLLPFPRVAAARGRRSLVPLSRGHTGPGPPRGPVERFRLTSAGTGGAAETAEPRGGGPGSLAPSGDARGGVPPPGMRAAPCSGHRSRARRKVGGRGRDPERSS